MSADRATQGRGPWNNSVESRMFVKIFTVANPKAFTETMEALALSFQELGHEAEVDHRVRSDMREFGDINVVITAHRKFDPNSLPKYSVNILLQTEQLWNRKKRRNYDKSRGWDLVLEPFAENMKIKRGIGNVRYFPFGYSPAFDRNSATASKIWLKAYFFGSMSRRRKEFRARLQGRFDNVRFAENDWGHQRDKNIVGARVNLFIKAQPRWHYPPIHYLLVQCKGKLILGEKPSGGSEGYVPGTHYVEFAPENLEDVCQWWLDRPRLCDEFGLAARNDLMQRHPMTRVLGDALKGVL